MPSTFPVGEQIIQISGLLEREDDYIHAKHYTAVLTFADESVALLAQNSIVRIAKIPDDTCDLPAQFIDCKETVVNCTVTNAFVMHKPLKNPYAWNGPQLFLVLDQEANDGHRTHAARQPPAYREHYVFAAIPRGEQASAA